jgi:hypothetical protein
VVLALPLGPFGVVPHLRLTTVFTHELNVPIYPGLPRMAVAASAALPYRALWRGVPTRPLRRQLPGLVTQQLPQLALHINQREIAVSNKR